MLVLIIARNSIAIVAWYVCTSFMVLCTLWSWKALVQILGTLVYCFAQRRKARSHTMVPRCVCLASHGRRRVKASQASQCNRERRTKSMAGFLVRRLGFRCCSGFLPGLCTIMHSPVSLQHPVDSAIQLDNDTTQTDNIV